MSDVLVVVCGGAAEALVSDAGITLSSDVEHISNNTTTLDHSDKESMIELMRKYRIVIPLCVIGGRLGSEMIGEVISCARAADCNVVSVIGLPFEIEAERRKMAVEMRRDIVKISDRAMAFDMEVITKIFKDRKAIYFFKMVDRSIIFAINSIIELMEGPFFTIFPEKEYKFADNSEVLVKSAAMNAIKILNEHVVGPKGNMTILVSSHITNAEIDDMKDAIVREYGFMPEVVRRKDREDDKAIVFLADRSA